MMPTWVDEYRGRPFARNGDGPAAYDCYGLVRAVLRDRWGLETPALDARWHAEAAESLAAATDGGAGPWVEADGEPQPSDVLAFAVPGQRELHVGVVVAPGWMLHARADVGVTTARYNRAPWSAARIGGTFRHAAAVVPA